jgi:hypothetical protein
MDNMSELVKDESVVQSTAEMELLLQVLNSLFHIKKIISVIP